MAVSSVSMQEINSVRGMSVPEIKKPVKKQDEKQKTKYIDKISEKKLAEFFAPYGFLGVSRCENGSIHIYCCDFEIYFNDFTLLAAPANNLYSDSTNGFNFQEFSDTCLQANLTPSQAIMDRLEAEIFNKMPGYISKKREFVRNNLASISRNKNYGALLRPAIENEKFKQDKSYLEYQYGTTDPEQMSSVIVRANTRN